MSTNYIISLLDDERSRNGESPFYDADNGRLIYIDYLAGDVVIHTMCERKTERTHVYDGWISFAIPVHGQPDSLLVAVDKNKIAIFDLAAKSIRIIKEFDLNGRFFHDGKCDASGRLWVGGAPLSHLRNEVALNDANKSAAGPENGCIYRFDGSTLDVMAEGFSMPNGLTWSNDNKRFFFADSLLGVQTFDFNVEMGTISKFFEFEKLYEIGQAFRKATYPVVRFTEQKSYHSIYSI